MVAADGRGSPLRALLGIPWHETPYGARALIANVTTGIPHGRVARQRFLASGPLAFLPLPDPHACSVVWSCEESLAARLATLDDAAFRQALGEAFEHRLGAIETSSARACFPLARARAERFAQGAVALVGDAAHLVHPEPAPERTLRILIAGEELLDRGPHRLFLRLGILDLDDLDEAGHRHRLGADHQQRLQDGSQALFGQGHGNAGDKAGAPVRSRTTSGPETLKVRTGASSGPRGLGP